MGSAVFDHIVQRFLHCTEQIERDVVIEVYRQILDRTLDLKLVLLGNFLAKITNGRGESEVMQLGGVQLMGYVLNISRNLIGQSPNLPQFILLNELVCADVGWSDS